MAMRNDHYVSFMSEERIARIAKKWRIQANLQGHWNFDIVHFLERTLKVFYKAKGELKIQPFDRADPSGKRAWVSYKPDLVLHIERKIWEAAKAGDGFARFVVAHEIGHILLHDHDAKPFSYDPEVQVRWCPDGHSAEWQANMFAYCFLLPDELVRQHYDVDALVELCGVNEEVANDRLVMIREVEARSPGSASSNGEACPKCMNFTLVQKADRSRCSKCGVEVLEVAQS